MSGVFVVDSEVVEFVESLVGMGAAAWDTVDPREIVAASILAYMSKNTQQCEHCQRDTKVSIE